MNNYALILRKGQISDICDFVQQCIKLKSATQYPETSGDAMKICCRAQKNNSQFYPLRTIAG